MQNIKKKFKKSTHVNMKYIKRHSPVLITRKLLLEHGNIIFIFN